MTCAKPAPSAPTAGQPRVAQFDRAGRNQTPSTGAASSATPRPVPALSAFIVPVLLDDDQSAACLGVSKRKFHELRAEAWMPRPVVLGPRLLRWPRAELEQAVTSMPRQETTSSEPAHLRRGKIESLKKRGVPA